MVKLGNFLFHYRNILFPVFYFLLFVPSPQLFDSNTFPLILGFAIGLLGQGLRMATIGLVYIIRGGKNRQIYAEGLVTEGLFSHCRNPLYAGNILMIIGLGIMSNSLFFIGLMIPLFLFFYQAIVLAEEQFLYGKFGDQYRQYMDRVNRWIPRLSGINDTLHSMVFKWRRVMIKEYNTTYIWSSAAVLLVVKAYYSSLGWEYVLLKLNWIILALITLLAGYLFVRYKKKSKQWTDN